MIRRLLYITISPFPSSTPQILTLIHPHSTRRTYRPNKNHQPPPLNQSELDDAISQLPSRFTPSDLTDVLSRLPSPHLCFHLFTWATHQPRFRLDPSTFLITIKKLGSARLYTQLQPIASLALSTLPPSQPLFNTIIYFFTEARFLTKAIYVYKLMRDSPEPTSKPNLTTYNLLFNGLLGRGSNSYIHHVYMDTIRSLFKQMVSLGVEPDLAALNFVVRGYVKSLHLNDALRVFHQFGLVYGVEPDESTYNCLVHGLCAQGRTRNAMEMYGEMKGKGMVVSLRAGNSLVSALAMGEEVGTAVRVMREVVGTGKGIEEMTLRTVVEGMWRERGREAAEGLVREFREMEVVNARLGRELMMWIQDGCDSEEIIQCLPDARYSSGRTLTR